MVNTMYLPCSKPNSSYSSGFLNLAVLANNVSIITLNHAVNVYDRLNCLVSIKDVNIEDHVWIGAGAIILPGVTIGENSVIGAGSVVTKDVPPNVLAYGNPCKVIKEINQEEK